MTGVSILEIKDGTFRVELSLPGHPLPHAVKDDFLSKESADLWVGSPEGRAIIAKIREAKRMGARA